MSKRDLHLRALLPHPSDYKEFRTSWARDLVAGITVGIVALPLALAFAISSGAPPEAGLITAVVAGFIAAVFGGSHVQVSGPTGAMVVVLAPIAALHGPAALPLVAILAGVLVVGAGVFRLGRAVSYIPWPVIEGFTLGIAVIIFLQQVPTALGTVPGSSNNSLLAALQSLPTVSWPAAGWALGASLLVVAVMMGGRLVSTKIPGSIVGIVLVTLLAEWLQPPLERIGDLPDSLPAPTMPPLRLDLLLELGPPVVAVALLAAIESLLSARVAAGMSSAGRYDGDRELVGQGLASVASGFFGGLPATGAIARTAVNVRSGARTRAAAAFHAIFLAVIVLYAGSVVALIPMVALAGVLMATAINMVDHKTAWNFIRMTRSDAGVFILTALVTVLFDLIIAVGIGIAATAFFALRALSKLSRVRRQELPGDPQPDDDRIALFRLDGALYFGVGDRVLNELEDIRNVSVVIIRMSQLQLLDSTGAYALSELATMLRRRGITMLIKGLQTRHTRIATRSGVMDSVHPEHMFESLSEAIEHARGHVSGAFADEDC